MSKNIYRFLSFPTFVDAVQLGRLAFVTYDMWEDPYEGFVLGALKNEEGRKRIRYQLKHMGHLMDPQAVLGILSAMRYTVHLQSWTRLSESDALWRIYGFGNMGIRIKTTVEKIGKIGKITVFDVDYREPSLEEELRRICAGRNIVDVRQAFLIKREAFKHEEEVRLITDIDKDFLPASPSPMPIEQEKMLLRQIHRQGKISAQDLDAGLKNVDETFKKQGLPPNQVKPVSFSHVDEFIESVLVHPMAPTWFVGMVAEFCNRNNLVFAGQSQLYTYKHG